MVLTDGIDTSSRLSASEVSGLASSINVPVYIVATVPSIDQRVMMEGTARGTRPDSVDLRDLAEWSGGHLVFASTFTETIVVASSIVDELRQQMCLRLAPDHEWRRLDVRVKPVAASHRQNAKRLFWRLSHCSEEAAGRSVHDVVHPTRRNHSRNCGPKI